MKKIITRAVIAAALGVCGAPSFAAVPVAVQAPQKVSFNFTAVSLMTFAQATYKDLLQRDFVLSPDLVSMDKRITVSVKSIEPTAVAAFVDDLLMRQGVKSEKRGSIFYLSPVSQDAPAEPVANPLLADAVHKPSVAVQGDETVKDSPVHDDDKIKLLRPVNRSVDFIVQVLNAAFGKPYGRAAGSQVLIVAPKAKLDEVLSLVESLDEAAKVVEVSASFVEVSRSASSSRGLSLVANVLGARFAASVGSGAGSVSVRGGSFEAVLDALDADGRFRQVSNSRLRGDDHQRMNLIVGDETPTVSSSGKDNQGNAVQNIVYRSSGVILDVTPNVLGSGRLSMLVDGQISNFISTVTGVVGSPTLVKRQVKTSITLADGEVVILGGLDDTKSTGSASGLSFLPKSWSGKSSADTHTDLVLILSAKVL